MKEESKKIHKEKLLAKAQEHKERLYLDTNTAAERVVIYGKNALVLGGALYVGYTILDKYLDAQFRTTKKSEPGKYEALNKIILPILAFALQQGSLSLIKKARLMLIDYLEKNTDD
jgi:hypothetical protein